MKSKPSKLNHRNLKKAQIITFDFSSSIIIFVIFLSIFIGVFLLTQGSEKKPDFEIEYVFSNLENNLKYGAAEGDFFADYRVDKTRLEYFASAIGSGSINSYVIGTVGGTGGSHGIGLDESSYDVCLYFTDNDKQILTITGAPEIKVLGSLNKTGSSCNHEMIIAGNDPCEAYKQATSLFKPVLLDENDYTMNRIIQMNIVMCKR
jgi:hypothetical protein